MKLLIVIPAYNEEKIIGKTIARAAEYCQKNLSVDWQIVVVSNNSDDKTFYLAREAANKYPGVACIDLRERGKGRAIRAGWQSQNADWYCFMDADLATDLSALVSLVAAINAGADVVVGSRYKKGSSVSRSLIRTTTSRLYQFFVKIITGVSISDAACGFKAVSNKVNVEILDLVQDQKWFFDSELVILAKQKGFKIVEMPVIWKDPRRAGDKSRVKVFNLGAVYIKKLLELRARLHE